MICQFSIKGNKNGLFSKHDTNLKNKQKKSHINNAHFHFILPMFGLQKTIALYEIITCSFWVYNIHSKHPTHWVYKTHIQNTYEHIYNFYNNVKLFSFLSFKSLILAYGALTLES